MKTFTKITALFFLSIVMLAMSPAAKAVGHNDEARTIEARLRGSDHIQAGSAITAELTSNFDAEASFTVENALGKRFADTKLSIDSGRNLVKFQVSEVPAGIYFIKIKAAGKIETLTFVVN